MSGELPFVLFLLNLRAVVLFSCPRIIMGTIGLSGCLTLSFVLSLFCFPSEVPEKILTRPGFSLICEITLGLMLGVILSYLIEFIPLVGRLIDTFRGVQFQEQVAPELGIRDSRLEIFGGYVVLFLLFQTQIFSHLVELFLNCSDSLGIGGLRQGVFIDTSQYFNDKRGVLIDLLSTIFYSALIIVSPLVVFSLSLELGLSILMKVNTKCSLGLDLSLVRALVGIFVLPLILQFSDSWSVLLSDLVRILLSFIYRSIS